MSVDPQAAAAAPISQQQYFELDNRLQAASEIFLQVLPRLVSIPEATRQALSNLALIVAGNAPVAVDVAVEPAAPAVAAMVGDPSEEEVAAAKAQEALLQDAQGTPAAAGAPSALAKANVPMAQDPTAEDVAEAKAAEDAAAAGAPVVPAVVPPAVDPNAAPPAA